MKKLLMPLFVAGFILSTVVSCNSDDDSSTTTEQTTAATEGQFILNDVTYDVTGGNGILVNLTDPLGDGNSRSTFTFPSVNLDTFETITVTLVLNYADSDGVSGTYELGTVLDEVGVLDNYLTNYSILNPTTGAVTSSNDGLVEGEDVGVTSGSATIQDNGSNNYTITYDLIFADGSTSSANTTLNFTSN